MILIWSVFVCTTFQTSKKKTIQPFMFKAFTCIGNLMFYVKGNVTTVLIKKN